MVRGSNNINNIVPLFLKHPCCNIIYEIKDSSRENDERELSLHYNTTARFENNLVITHRTVEGKSFFSEYINNQLMFRMELFIYTTDNYLFKLQQCYGIKSQYLKTIKYERKFSLNDYIYKYSSGEFGIEPSEIDTIWGLGKVILYNNDYELYDVVVIQLNVSSRMLRKNRDIKRLYKDKCDKSNISGDRIREIIFEYIRKKNKKCENKEWLDEFEYKESESLYCNLWKSNYFGWGLIGNAEIVNYSIAPRMWNAVFEFLALPIHYLVINTDKEAELLDKYSESINRVGMLGFNVAMPWKKRMCDECEIISYDTALNRTINTLYRNEGKIMGSNTDGIGLIRAIRNYCDFTNKQVLLLGAGGVAQTVPQLLAKEGVKIIYIYDICDRNSRELLANALKETRDTDCEIKIIDYEHIGTVLPMVDFVINATPCGMAGRENECVLNRHQIELIEQPVVFIETIYNPEKTKLLNDAQSFGHTIISGVDLLVYQAAYSFEKVFGEKMDNELVCYAKKVVLSYFA